MIKRLTEGALLMVGLMLIGCDSGPKLTTEQRRGKQIYESLCDKCHKLIPPKNHTDEQWPVAVQKYGTQLRLVPEELRAVSAYLTRANDPDFK